jgi:hypothetical protein
MSNQDDDSYKIGKGKPPRHTQFKKGQSGNPGGRKKGQRNFKTILSKIMESEIELTENDRTRKVLVVEAIVLRQVENALHRDFRSGDSLLNRYERLAGEVAEDGQDVAEEDEAILQRHLKTGSRSHLPSPAEPIEGEELDEWDEDDE